MPRFVTDWIKIGQSGPTTDGRTINPEWLTQAAESYSPDTYTAMIWMDHMRFYGNYGQVRELKAEQEGQITSLYARLMPNQWLLNINRNEEKLFTSMELDPNFAESGKCYLVGLGVTDEPASLGTHELMFSKRKQHNRNLMVCGVELGRLQNDDEGAGAIARLVSELARFFRKEQPDTPSDEDPMDEKQFKELKDAVTATTTAVNGLVEKLSTAAPAAPADPATPENPAEPAAPADPPAAGSEDMQAQFKAVTDAIAGVTEKLTALETRMEKAVPGTPTPETTTPADGGDELY